MKQTETKIVQEWNYRFPDKKLTLSPYPYERFDAFNERYIVEIKYRASWYDKLLIEFDKYSYNSWYAHITNKKFLYAVAHESKIIVFNITNINKTEYDYNWKYNEMPKQTEFNDRDKIIKFVGYLDHNTLKETKDVYEFGFSKNPYNIYIK